MSNVTRFKISEYRRHRQRKLTDAQMEYFQARQGIRAFPELADAIIAGFKQNHSVEVTLLNNLREIASEVNTQPIPYQEAA